MEVTVDLTKCGRCGKKKEEKVSLEKAKEMEAAVQIKERARELILEFAKTLDPGIHPELIVLAAYEDGETVDGSQYGVFTLRDLCSKPAEGDKKTRGCRERVATLLDEIFATPKPRAPRTKKEKKE